MAIPKKPKTPGIPKTADSFIAEANKKEPSRWAITLRLKPDILERIDAAAKSEGLKRASFITRVIVKYLNTNMY